MGDDAAGHGTQHEPGGDERQLHDGLALQPYAVGDRQREVGRHDEDEGPRPDERGPGQAGGDQRDADARGERRRELPLATGRMRLTG